MKVENCVLKNCQFINCNLSDFDGTETIFDECTFLKSGFNNNLFELCHFLKPIFESSPLGSATIINCKFSNSKKSIEFEGNMFLLEILDQINNLHIDEE